MSKMPRKKRECLFCGTIFTPTGKRKLFCQDDCRKKANTWITSVKNA